MMDFESYRILQDNRESLKETSKDDSDPSDIKYMTSSEKLVVNFDLVKRYYVNALGRSENTITSVDAIVPLENRILFVEFKNGEVNNRNVKDKLRDSLLVFLDIIEKNINFSRENIDLVVVYNLERNPFPRKKQKGELQETPSRVAIADYVMEKAQEEFIRFDLERYKRIYFRDVHTYSKEQFDEYWENLRLG